MLVVTDISGAKAVGKARAKLNLCLHLRGIREDGFHLLESLVTPIELADKVSIELRSQPGFIIRCEGFPELENTSNLAVKAAAWYSKTTGVPPFGATIELTKNIPISAGLAGGSSDAACVLHSLQELFKHPISDTELCKKSVELGADVPICFDGRCRWVSGIGDVLDESVELEPFAILLANPGWGVATSFIYEKARNRRLTKPGVGGRKTARFLSRAEVIGLLQNDLETVTFTEFDGLFQMKSALREESAEGVLMTGSGPTLFAIFATREQADAAKAKLIPRFPAWTFWVTSNSNFASEEGLPCKSPK